MSCGFNVAQQIQSQKPASIDYSPLPPPSNNEPETELWLYSAIAGKVLVNGIRRGNRFYCQHQLSLGGSVFNIKTIDFLHDYPDLNAMDIYSSEQLRRLKTASVNLDKNRMAYVISLLAFERICEIKHLKEDLEQTKNILAVHREYLADQATLQKMMNFGLRYINDSCEKLLQGRSDLPFAKLNFYYSKFAAYNASVDVLYHNTQFLMFLYEVYDRIGIDDSKDFYSIVNAKNLDNAFYNPQGYMVFGSGNTTFYPLVSADVGAHEWGHRLNTAVCNQKYEKHSGGLNEAFSDMQGCSYEFYIYQKNKDNCEFRGREDWLIGEDLSRNYTTRKLRDMINPEQGLTPQPKTYGGKYWPDVNNLGVDHGGVHTSSGPANRLFYLICTRIHDNDYRKTALLFYKCYNSFHSTSNYIDLRDEILKREPKASSVLVEVGLTPDAVSDETLISNGKSSIPPRFPKQRYPQPRYPQPRYPQPRYPQPRFPQPRFPQPRFPQPRFPQPRFPQPIFPKHRTRE